MIKRRRGWRLLRVSQGLRSEVSRKEGLRHRVTDLLLVLLHGGDEAGQARWRGKRCCLVEGIALCLCLICALVTCEGERLLDASRNLGHDVRASARVPTAAGRAGRISTPELVRSRK